LPVAILPFAALMAVNTPYLALVVFIVVYAWFGLGAGMIAPAWQDLLASCFPVQRRGWMFGITAFIGTGAAAVGALVITWALAEFEYPYNFALIFGAAAVSILVSWCFLAFLREPVQKLHHSADVSAMTWWTRATTIVRDDSNFRRFVIARALMVFSMMGAGFLTVAAIQRFDVPDSTVGWYTFLMLIGQTIGSLTSGLIADRWGHKVPMVLGAVAQLVAFTMALLAWRPEVYYGVFVLVGYNMGVNLVSGILIALEFSAPERRPSYVGIANTTVGVAGSIAPLVGGWLAYYSYSLLFGMCVMLGVAAVAALFLGVHDPRWLPVKSRALPESV
jgi:MFS family permease